jgi:hypothetical protein
MDDQHLQTLLAAAKVTPINRHLAVVFKGNSRDTKQLRAQERLRFCDCDLEMVTGPRATLELINRKLDGNGVAGAYPGRDGNAGPASVLCWPERPPPEFLIICRSKPFQEQR